MEQLIGASKGHEYCPLCQGKQEDMGVRAQKVFGDTKVEYYSGAPTSSQANPINKW